MRADGKPAGKQRSRRKGAAEIRFVGYSLLLVRGARSEVIARKELQGEVSTGEFRVVYPEFDGCVGEQKRWSLLR